MPLGDDRDSAARAPPAGEPPGDRGGDRDGAPAQPFAQQIQRAHSAVSGRPSICEVAEGVFGSDDRADPGQPGGDPATQAGPVQGWVCTRSYRPRRTIRAEPGQRGQVAVAGHAEVGHPHPRRPPARRPPARGWSASPPRSRPAGGAAAAGVAARHRPPRAPVMMCSALLQPLDGPPPQPVQPALQEQAHGGVRSARCARAAARAGRSAGRGRWRRRSRNRPPARPPRRAGRPCRTRGSRTR